VSILSENTGAHEELGEFATVGEPVRRPVLAELTLEALSQTRYGYEREALVGRAIPDVAHHVDTDVLRKALTRLRARGASGTPGGL
jgi:hypothetical protein